VICPSSSNCTWPPCENCPSCYSVAGRRHCRRPQISFTVPPSRLTKRGVSRSSRTLRRDAMDAAAHETNAPAADGKAVWSWRPDAGVKFAGNALQATVAKKPGHRGERGISRKPLRREGRTVSANLWRLRSCAFLFACEAAGAASTRLSLRPPSIEGQCFVHHSGAVRAARSRSHVLLPCPAKAGATRWQAGRRRRRLFEIQIRTRAGEGRAFTTAARSSSSRSRGRRNSFGGSIDAVRSMNPFPAADSR